MEFGVNLNNREPLITSDYTLADLLDLAELAEQRGFGSVWVGDSLFSKPRYEPISLLSAISQRTSRARLGTACLVTSTRNPLYLALEWATLDQMSGGRTVLGACMGNPEHGVRQLPNPRMCGRSSHHAVLDRREWRRPGPVRRQGLRRGRARGGSGCHRERAG